MPTRRREDPGVRRGISTLKPTDRWWTCGAPRVLGRASSHAGLPAGRRLRGGHIPGAANVPSARAVREDGTFKSSEELKSIYEGEAGLSRGRGRHSVLPDRGSSSHTWFVLTYLLGYDKVRNYDGSWTEWGNLVRAPIER